MIRPVLQSSKTLDLAALDAVFPTCHVVSVSAFFNLLVIQQE